MTLISSLIRDAYRESNLIATSANPSTAEVTEGVSVLNQFLGSLFGHEAGQEFVDLSVAAATATLRPNERALVSYNSGNVTLTLPAVPDNGARVQIVDTVIGGSRTLTLNPNGRKITGAATLVLAAGSNKVYMYRADLGDWLVISPLASSDTLPFPVDYEPLFVAAIAIRINDRHGQPVPEQLKAVFDRDIERIKFDYRQHGQADEPRTRALLNRALRLAGHVPDNAQPRAAQLTDALRRLNAAINSLFGEELGERLVDYKVSDLVEINNSFVPNNSRIIGDGTTNVTLKLMKFPQNGSRLGIVGDFATHSLTLTAEASYTIEGASSITLSANSTRREWFFRADQGNWVRLAPLVVTDEPPFTEEFDQLLEIMTAIRLDPTKISDVLIAAGKRMTAQFKNRYRQSIEMASEWALLKGYSSKGERYNFDGDPTDMFNLGIPYRRF